MQEYIKMKKSNCTNCFKCIRHCPVKSIRFSGNQAHIITDDCILCGRCFTSCPQDAMEIIDDTQRVKTLLWSDSPVVASIAPAFVAYFDGVTIKSIERALRQLGFYSAEETAIGATFVKNEYERLVKTGRRNVIISSCCHSVNLLIQKNYPRALNYLANIISPMETHCIDIKRRIPDVKTVFIGPCISKKDEADVRAKESVDAVLTFDDLKKWFESEGIVLETEEDNNSESRTRLFPTPGGILRTMKRSGTDYTYLSISGLENCIQALKDIENGSLGQCFIEMSACEGSCTGGPIMIKDRQSTFRDQVSVQRYAGEKDFPITSLPDGTMGKNFPNIYKETIIPTEAQISAIMKEMGKTQPESELNCGSCGYDTCHDKAIAVFQGKADVSMCMPFLKSKAETFSDNIIKNIHYGVIVLNEFFEVQQLNRAAMKIVNIRNESEVLGGRIDRILDSTDFERVYSTGQEIRNRRTFLVEYQKFVDQTIIYDPEVHIIICMMRDVTKEETKKEKKEAFNRQTAEIADKMVEKQMRIVQEIASLLGETTADTKIALTKLKESISDE